jgi:hypothetical protein
LKQKLQGRLVTFTTDGWKNNVKQSIVASMVSVASKVSLNQEAPNLDTDQNEFQPYLMHTHDISADAKSGATLLKLVVKDILVMAITGTCTE